MNRTCTLLRRALAGRAIARYGRDILASPGMDVERKIIQHGDTDVCLHSLCVAYLALRLALRLRLAIDARALVRAALLHDYFLYDWHERGHGIAHGVRHPQLALANARKAFMLTAREQDAIARHMFPLDPRPPRYAEGWLICLCDKVAAVGETIGRPALSGRMLLALDAARERSPQEREG